MMLWDLFCSLFKDPCKFRPSILLKSRNHQQTAVIFRTVMEVSIGRMLTIYFNVRLVARITGMGFATPSQTRETVSHTIVEAVPCRFSYQMLAQHSISIRSKRFLFIMKTSSSRSLLIVRTLSTIKKIILNKTAPGLFETDWEEIDGITFTPERNYETSKPETFALTCLNLLL